MGVAVAGVFAGFLVIGARLGLRRNPRWARLSQRARRFFASGDDRPSWRG